ncbi:RNA polymerase sigma factor [Roseimaritima multifibrata]|uniref:RNA polymerase sigma factor n=1 Tax=Roseimaritima multifibrata TaxID=1930274 RepID=A0A517MJM3_9BACT|nr:sigma-70 family RNA polymerase sigma factor [Roseimaritima multifibrata]QDS95040.1 RNA polymerase sigma factor [Roseimaritima multifibrata]
MDSQSLQTLIDQHGAALKLIASQYCDHAEDAVQEALLALIDQHEPPRDVPAWMFTTVRRKAMNMTRAEVRRRKHHRHAGENHAAWFCESPTEPSLPGDCQAALKQLNPQNREIVILRIWGEQTFEQIATVVQLSLSTVHRRYQDAIAELERHIADPTTTEINQ